MLVRRPLICPLTLSAPLLAYIAPLLAYIAPLSASAAETGTLLSASNEYNAPNEYSVTLPKATAREREASRLNVQPNLKGWDHLYSLLADEGVDPGSITRVLSDPRMPTRQPLYFSLTPRESRSLYRKHNSVAARKNALRFYSANASHFIRAERELSVPRSMILSLLQIETSCGAVTGNDRVFYRLARLASAAAPDNVEANYRQKKQRTKLLRIDNVRKRANVLQNLFVSHTAATFSVARTMGIHPLDVRGSSAGAIGMPQFLPGNVKRFGIDGDKDGEINLFTPADAILSVARFLNSHGWNSKSALSSEEKREILYHYNRSEPYVDTALALARALDRDLSQNPNTKGK